VSSGDVIATMENLAERELSHSMAAEWSDLSFLQKQSSKSEELRDLQQNPITAFVIALRAGGTV
jgi:multidrug efflux pump